MQLKYACTFFPFSWMWNKMWQIVHMSLSIIERHSNKIITVPHLCTQNGQSIIYWSHMFYELFKTLEGQEELKLKYYLSTEIYRAECRIFFSKDWSDTLQRWIRDSWRSIYLCWTNLTKNTWNELPSLALFAKRVRSKSCFRTTARTQKSQN